MHFNTTISALYSQLVVRNVTLTCQGIKVKQLNMILTLIDHCLLSSFKQKKLNLIDPTDIKLASR
jgi:hypothetical protein